MGTIMTHRRLAALRSASASVPVKYFELVTDAIAQVLRIRVIGFFQGVANGDWKQCVRQCCLGTTAKRRPCCIDFRACQRPTRLARQ